MTLREKLYELVAHSTTGIAILEAADACILEAHISGCEDHDEPRCNDSWFGRGPDYRCSQAKAIKEQPES